jgi:enoyl-CoA hydratase/carnithine racemase
MVGFIRIDLACDTAVSLFLSSLIGVGRPAQYTFSNEPINAEQALTWELKIGW